MYVPSQVPLPLLCTVELGAWSEMCPAVPEAQVTYPTISAAPQVEFILELGGVGLRLRVKFISPQHKYYLETVEMASRSSILLIYMKLTDLGY